MIPKLSRNRIQKAIESRVRISWDAPVRPSTPVREGEEVYVDDPAVNEEVIPFDPPVLFQDEDLLAIDKPPGLVVHPTHSHLRNTVITLLRQRTGEPELTLAHRLDAETSGVLLLGRNRDAARRIQLSFERGKVKKAYLAVVFGCPPEDEFVIDLPLGPVSRDKFVFRQGPEAQTSRHALTKITVQERFGPSTLILAEPVTGRRHQIRAHLAQAGFPIVGDKLYVLGDRLYRRYLRLGALDEEMLAILGAPRCLLHSHRLSIPHPRDPSRLVVIVSPPPSDFPV